MKKETRVKDLPQILIDLIYSNMNPYGWDEAKEHLDKIDWQKCTNEERLAYAELMYPVGTIFISAKVESNKRISRGNLRIEPDGIWADTLIYGSNQKCFNLVYHDGKFATIIEALKKGKDL